VVASWLLRSDSAALVEDPALSKFAGRVSGFGRRPLTINAAIDEGVPVPVLSARFSSASVRRAGGGFMQISLLSAMRYQLGGHSKNLARRKLPEEDRPP